MGTYHCSLSAWQHDHHVNEAAAERACEHTGQELSLEKFRAAETMPDSRFRRDEGSYNILWERNLRQPARPSLASGLVGKRSEQDPENSTTWTTTTEGHLCLPQRDSPTLQAWMPPRAPLDQAWSPQLPVGWRPGAMVSEPAIPAAERTQMRP
nr:PREDICTED: secretin [Equus przewalskii]